MNDRTSDQSMHEGYRERLVFTETSDALPLEGLVIAPAQSSSNLAIVWIHGGAAKFYDRQYVEIGRGLASRDYTFVAGNTRGHDGFTLLWRSDGIMLGGGAFERFDEAPRDIAAWVDLAMEFGVRGVVLVGHSLGASKVVHYQAAQQDTRVLGLIAASPVPGWPSNPQRALLAEQMVRKGRGEELLPHLEGTPPWNIVSAQTVHSREEVIRHTFDSDARSPDIAQVRCPLLILYGEEEMVDPAWLETLRANAQSAASVDTEVVERTGHEYAGQEGQVTAVIADWIGIRVLRS